MKKNLEKHKKAEILDFTKDDLRWATNEVVAEYRAKKLKCDVITDIGCGIGFQSFSFAKYCKKVYAIEINKSKIEKAKINAKKLGINNIIFITGDALDDKIINQVKDSEIIFCDTDRPETEKERNIESIKPNIKKLLEKYKKITDKIAIEFPPQIKEIPLDCEKEYVSLNGKLNRLTLYFGKLKTNENSAIVLPSEKKIFGKKDTKLKPTEIKKYIYEIDPAVIKAEIINELIKETKTELANFEKLNFLTSNEKITNDFFKNSYEILEICKFEDAEIIKNLKKHYGKEVEIRFNIEPKDYWKIRKKYEEKLLGKEKLFLFKIKDFGIIAKKI